MTIVKINIFHGQNTNLTMTIGKFAGCQWPWSFCNHDHSCNLEIAMVK